MVDGEEFSRGRPRAGGDARGAARARKCAVVAGRDGGFASLPGAGLRGVSTLARIRSTPHPATELCPHYGGNLGDFPAARGWGARAGRLVEEFELAPLEGWVLLGRAAGASSGGDPRVGEGFARQALEIARRVGDTDLELCALSQLGGALARLGRMKRVRRCSTRRWRARSAVRAGRRRWYTRAA